LESEEDYSELQSGSLSLGDNLNYCPSADHNRQLAWPKVPIVTGVQILTLGDVGDAPWRDAAEVFTTEPMTEERLRILEKTWGRKIFLSCWAPTR